MGYQRVLIFVVVIVGALFITPAAASLDGGTDEPYPVAQAGYDTGSITQTLKLIPETPGTVRVATSADLPLAVNEFYLYIPEAAEKVKVDGFRQTTKRDPPNGFRNYEWDGTNSPIITYNLDVNKTNSGGKYKNVDAGKWAIIDTPSIPYYWSGSEDVQININHRVAGPGVSRDGFTFLGKHNIESSSANGQQFRLVIPEAANLTEKPDIIFDNIAYASNQLQVGERDKEVVMIAAPTIKEIQWANGGVAKDSIFWVADSAEVDSPNNLWIHEYVHTRQAFDRTGNFEWFAEGSPQYYAALFTLQQKQIGFEEFRGHLVIKESGVASKTLTETKDSAWAQYSKGGLVAARTDQQIRLITNGSASLTEIFRRLNEEKKPISNTDFIRYVGLYSNDGLESEIQAATTTPHSLTMWDKEEHTQAFEEEPHELGPQVNEANTKSLIYLSKADILYVIAIIIGLSIGMIRLRQKNS